MTLGRVRVSGADLAAGAVTPRDGMLGDDGTAEPGCPPHSAWSREDGCEPWGGGPLPLLPRGSQGKGLGGLGVQLVAGRGRQQGLPWGRAEPPNSCGWCPDTGVRWLCHQSQGGGVGVPHPPACPGVPVPSTGQLCLCTLCSLLMRSRRPWLFGAPLLPVLARLCGLPLHALPVLNTFAVILTALEVLYVLGSHVLVPFQLAAAACREVVQVSGKGGLEDGGLRAVGQRAVGWGAAGQGVAGWGALGWGGCGMEAAGWGFPC